MYVYLKQEYKRWGKPIKQLGPDAEAVMKDMKTDINIPFALRWDPRNSRTGFNCKNSNEKERLPILNPEFPESVELYCGTERGGSNALG